MFHRLFHRWKACWHLYQSVNSPTEGIIWCCLCNGKGVEVNYLQYISRKEGSNGRSTDLQMWA